MAVLACSFCFNDIFAFYYDASLIRFYFGQKGNNCINLMSSLCIICVNIMWRYYKSVIQKLQYSIYTFCKKQFSWPTFWIKRKWIPNYKFMLSLKRYLSYAFDVSFSNVSGQYCQIYQNTALNTSYRK